VRKGWQQETGKPKVFDGNPATGPPPKKLGKCLLLATRFECNRDDTR